MGAKTWMVVYADGDAADALGKGAPLDHAATLELAAALFPREKLEEVGAADLTFTCPPKNEIHIGCFPGVAVVAAEEFAGDHPSRLPQNFLRAAPAANVYLHAMHSVVDWFAFAHWKQGTLVRSLSLSPDSGILEDIGARLPFEQPYWSGQHPAVDPEEEPEGYPLPFHPLDLGEEALLHLFGYHIEGPCSANVYDPRAVPLLRLRRRSSWWRKFWQ